MGTRWRSMTHYAVVLVLLWSMLIRVSSSEEAAAAYYNPVSHSIGGGNKPPNIWEAAPTKNGWIQPNITAQHLEEMRGLCASALAAKFPGRDGEYTLSTAGGGVRIKAPDDIREFAGKILGILMAARRSEVGLTLEHYALSRGAAARLDGLPSAILDAEIEAWLQSEALKAAPGEAVLLGRLSAAGTAGDSIVSDNVTPVPTAYVRHESNAVIPTLVYLPAVRGGWFSSQVSPAGPTRWNLSLRFLMAWTTTAVDAEAEISLVAGQVATTRKAALRLPAWRSLAFSGHLMVPSGNSVLLALAGTSDDKSATPGHPFEAVILHVDDVLYSTTSGPVAVCFDGSRLDPAMVVEKMRALYKEAEKKDTPPKVWCGSNMVLLDDVALRPLFLKAVKSVQAANEPQRLRILMGGKMPVGLAIRGASVDAQTAGNAAAAWWAGDGLVSVASVAATSGVGSSQLDLQVGEVGKAGVGLAQQAISNGIVVTAGCSGPGKRRRIAVTAALGVPEASLSGFPSTAVNVDRQLEMGTAFLMPAGGRAPNGGALVMQLGPLVEAESASGTTNEWAAPSY